jgi:serine/threonine protein kinase
MLVDELLNHAIAIANVMFNTGNILNQSYQLQQRLGNTATGHQTWLTINLQSQERVTVKLLAFNPQMRWEELKLFEREAQILQALNHSRIPRYRDYFDIDKDTGGGVPWFALVQDYIPGFSLQELIEQGKRFTENEVRSLLTELLEILIYLHELKPPVLHRDIKPSNLILGADDRIYLIDFGAVQAQAAVTGMTFTIVGTSGYAPLEQFWGRAVPASDLYALGATLIHLLTGIAPADLPQKDSRIQFSDRVELQSNLLGWIEKATEISIEKRFDSAREALHYLKFQSAKILTDSQLINTEKIEALENRLRKTQLPNGNVEIFIPKPEASFRFSFEIFYARSLILNYILVRLLVNFIESFDLIIIGTSTIILIVFILTFIYTLLIKKSYNALLELKTKEIVLTYKFSKNNILGTSSFTQVITNQSWQNIVGFFMCQKGKMYQVFLYTKDKTYLVSNNLSRYEATWLTQELRNWLEEKNR